MRGEGEGEGEGAGAGAGEGGSRAAHLGGGDEAHDAQPVRGGVRGRGEVRGGVQRRVGSQARRLAGSQARRLAGLQACAWSVVRSVARRVRRVRGVVILRG